MQNGKSLNAPFIVNHLYFSCYYVIILSIFDWYFVILRFKGIFSDSNNIFLWHKSEDINKKMLFPKFQLILILHS